MSTPTHFSLYRTLRLVASPALAYRTVFAGRVD